MFQLGFLHVLGRVFVSPPYEGRSLGRRDNCDRSARTSIFQRPSLDIQNPSASDFMHRADGGICDHDDTLSSAKLFIVGIRESETNIAAGCWPREYDDGFKAFVGTYIGFAAIDLELVCLNGNLELAGVGIITRQASFDKLDIRIRV